MIEIRQLKTRRIVIVGGGISGLAAAQRLVERRASENLARNSIARRKRPARRHYSHAQARRILLEGGPDSFISENRKRLPSPNASESATNSSKQTRRIVEASLCAAENFMRFQKAFNCSHHRVSGRLWHPGFSVERQGTHGARSGFAEARGGEWQRR
jgi:glycine/D-amino acid oxidase-like deaminating enzyme